MQSARTLFRMSLIHLPLFMGCAVLHRIPNLETFTWTRLINYMQSGAEHAERRLYKQMHGCESDATCGSMLFPFSPPLVIPSPCPYSLAKSSLGLSTSDPDVSNRGNSVSQMDTTRQLKPSR
jgi:hypothetical protein